MKRHSLVRTIYLYLFSLLGLSLLTIGGVRFVDMALKAFVFTKAEEMRSIEEPYMLSPYPLREMEEVGDKCDLSEEEKALLQQWLQDYKSQQEKRSKVNYVVVERHKEASINLSLIVVGLPLYLYHWGTIKKDIREKKEG